MPLLQGQVNKAALPALCVGLKLYRIDARNLPDFVFTKTILPFSSSFVVLCKAYHLCGVTGDVTSLCCANCTSIFLDTNCNECFALKIQLRRCNNDIDAYESFALYSILLMLRFCLPIFGGAKSRDGTPPRRVSLPAARQLRRVLDVLSGLTCPCAFLPPPSAITTTLFLPTNYQPSPKKALGRQIALNLVLSPFTFTNTLTSSPHTSLSTSRREPLTQHPPAL